MKGRLSIICLTCVAFFWAQAKPARAESPGDILIVANKGVAVDSVSVDELKAFFFKQRTSWKKGGKVVPVHAKEGSSLREAFLAKVLSMQLTQEIAFWQEQKIRKGISAPPEFSNTLKAVFKIKGSLSYVFRKDFKEGVVKVILVLPN
ncbi:MAG: hypothetical protein GY854_07435 [Deltaproteobacteria bacterium]|nr:hypothetical protein [Deltaproteobacteria bacterium]